MRKRAECAIGEGTYPLEYGILRVRRLDVFGRFSAFGRFSDGLARLWKGLARLALHCSLHFRLLSGHLDGLRGLLYFRSNLSFRCRKGHIALTTVATALASVTAMVAARVLGAGDADFA
jgi:hypothetical protein